jgi:phospholipase/lecithinase/hemolysin
VNNADFVYDMTHSPLGDVAAWASAINESLANHWNALTNLYYAKGARTLVMPNAVDITEIPAYANLAAANKSFVRQRVIEFNTAFAAMLNQAGATLPGIKIYAPDLFALLDDILARPASYGVTNALYQGQIVDALHDPELIDASLNGPGANYIFWDDMDPTAKANAVIGDYVHQLITPVKISNLTVLDGSNRLDVANVPIGLDGSVTGSSNLLSGTWTSVTNFDSTSATQAIFVPASSSPQYYRLQFPFAWTWP